MDAITYAVYEPPKEHLPLLVVVFLPLHDSLLVRPAWSREEADELLIKIQDEVGSGTAVGNA